MTSIMTDDFSKIDLGYDPDDHCYNAGLYILKHRKPVLAKSVLEWGRWYERNHHRIRLSFINNICISTKYLGVDYDFTRSKEPVVFETAIAYDVNNPSRHLIDYDVFARCSTWRGALNNHKAAKNEMIKKGMLK